MKEYNLAENLIHLRTNKGISQKEIAAYLGIKQAAYSKYEVGETEPKIPTLIKLARYYETDLNSLVGFSPLSPYEKAVKHLKYVVPNSQIKKNKDGFVTCSISRKNESMDLKNTNLISTEEDFIKCIKYADIEAIKELQQAYNDRFVIFFSSAITYKWIEFSGSHGIKMRSEKEAVENLIKKLHIPDSFKEHKTRSDKKGGK